MPYHYLSYFTQYQKAKPVKTSFFHIVELYGTTVIVSYRDATPLKISF